MVTGSKEQIDDGIEKAHNFGNCGYWFQGGMVVTGSKKDGDQINR